MAAALQTSILALPDEVIRKVASHLDTTQRLCVLPLVCKRWHTAVLQSGAAWESLKLQLAYMMPLKQASCIAWLARAAGIRSLSLGVTNDSLTSAALAMVHKTLCTLEIDGPLSGPDLALIASCPSLTSLSLTWTDSDEQAVSSSSR
ncbi:hypothetical protein WJX72_009818 [[Myrmecia] bisecta]|uniref:F-box domain-containing protein n=1 Tax=[Myrmecia] bisecta TaxID=41462 RepID=A0AAW1PGV2_9CHLO